MFREKTFVFFWLCYCRLVGVSGDELKSVTEGESVTLQSGVTEVQEDDLIMWRFGAKGPLLAKTNGVTNTIPDDLDGRFRDRLKLDKKTGSLTITNTTTEHSGVYEVEISTSSSDTEHRFTVAVYDTPPTSHPASASSSHPASGSSSHPASGSSSHPASGSPSHPAPDLIVPISAVAGSLMTVAAVGMIWICRKQKKTDQGDETAETREEEITYAAPTFYKKREKKSEDEVIYAGVVTRR